MLALVLVLAPALALVLVLVLPSISISGLLGQDPEGFSRNLKDSEGFSMILEGFSRVLNHSSGILEDLPRKKGLDESQQLSRNLEQSAKVLKES